MSFAHEVDANEKRLASWLPRHATMSQKEVEFAQCAIESHQHRPEVIGGAS